MKERIREHFKELVGIPAVSGREQGVVVRYLRDRMAPLADEVSVSTIGNLSARRRGRPAACGRDLPGAWRSRWPATGCRR